MKYYFLAITSLNSAETKQRFFNTVCKGSPFDYMIKLVASQSAPHNYGKEYYRYTLLSFSEICQSDYDKLKDLLNA